MSYSKASSYDENPFAPEAGSHAPLATSNAEPPAWLKDNNVSQLESQPVNMAANAELDANIPRMIQYTRILNLILSICMIIASLLSLLTTDNATTGVLACYVVVFSCLLCCFEINLKQISKLIAFNFGFMYSTKSRSIFMIFVGTILFSFSLFGKIIGLCMLANSFFNIYILFKYPGYEDAQRNYAMSDIKDYLSANPAFAQQVVSLGTAATTTILAAAASNNSNSDQSSDKKTAPPSSFTI